MTMVNVSACVLWLLCGLLAAGYAVAFLDRQIGPYRTSLRGVDRGAMWACGVLGGPFALLVVLFLTDRARCGWRLR